MTASSLTIVILSLPPKVIPYLTIHNSLFFLSFVGMQTYWRIYYEVTIILKLLFSYPCLKPIICDNIHIYNVILCLLNYYKTSLFILSWPHILFHPPSCPNAIVPHLDVFKYFTLIFHINWYISLNLNIFIDIF